MLPAAREVSGKLEEEAVLGGGLEELGAEVDTLQGQGELGAEGEAHEGQGDDQLVDEWETLSSSFTGLIRLGRGWTLLVTTQGKGRLS